MKGLLQKWHHISPMKLIAGGYLAIVLIGTLLLSLPIATRGAGRSPVSDCFFTAASATCVTGLIRFDTYTHWTLFGQLVILGLIQIGGLGFMTVAMIFMVFARSKIGLHQRLLMQNSISAPQLGGIVRMTRFIVKGTVLIEGIGALLLSFVFVPMYGVAKGIYFSVFHSISAFCNGGFDLMGGTTGPFSSLTGMAGNWYVNMIIMLLIVIGGLGFFVWADLIRHRFTFRGLSLQSKMVLSISLALVVGGGILIFLTQIGNPEFERLPVSEKILGSLFQSVTARTAGFNTWDLGRMTEAGLFVMIVLMLIGGSTGSTAGGVKTTTFWVLCTSIGATFRHRKNLEAFGRRMEEDITRMASCVFMTYLIMTTGAAVFISAVERLPLLTALFETVSAMATVGVTMGITTQVGMVSKMLLAFLMICGRVGSVTMLLAFSSEKRTTSSRYPLDKVQVG